MESVKATSNTSILVQLYRGILGTALLVYLFLKMELPKDLLYYTYQANILCGVWLLLSALSPNSFWTKHAVKGAVVTYITITGLVYNTLLLPYELEYRGYLPFNSILTHMIVPIVFVADYFLTHQKDGVRWRALGVWLEYPIAYLLLTLGVGWRTGFYPYWFISPDTIENTGTLIRNYLFLLGLHATVATVFIAITRAKHRKSTRK